MTPARGDVGRRALVGAFDQAVSSLANALLAVCVARQTPVDEFGKYALAFSLYSFAAGLTRATNLQPYTVRMLDDINSRTKVCASATLAFAVLVSAAVAIVGLVLQVDTIGFLAVGLPGLLLQDSWRGIFVANRSPLKAVAGTFLYIALVAVGFGLAINTGAHSASVFVAIWGGGATVAAILGFIQARVLPGPRGVVEFYRKNTDLTKYMASEWILAVGSIQIATFGIATVASTAAVAGIRGAQTLLGPLNILSMSIVNMAVPDLSRSRPNGSAAVRSALFISGIVGVFGLSLSLMLLLLPSAIGSLLLGESWAVTSEALPGMCLWIVALGAASGPIVVLRVWERARASFAINALCGVVILVTGPWLAFTYGAAGAALGYGLGTALTLGVWWSVLYSAARKRAPTDEGTDLGSREAECRNSSLS